MYRMDTQEGAVSGVRVGASWSGLLMVLVGVLYSVMCGV